MGARARAFSPLSFIAAVVAAAVDERALRPLALLRSRVATLVVRRRRSHVRSSDDRRRCTRTRARAPSASVFADANAAQRRPSARQRVRAQNDDWGKQQKKRNAAATTAATTTAAAKRSLFFVLFACARASVAFFVRRRCRRRHRRCARAEPPSLLRLRSAAATFLDIVGRCEQASARTQLKSSKRRAESSESKRRWPPLRRRCDDDGANANARRRRRYSPLKQPR